MNKTTQALNASFSLLNLIRRDKAWDTDIVDAVLENIREVLADSKPAPDGRIPKTVFTLDDISKAAEIGRQAGMIDALAEPVKQKPVGVVEPSEEWGVAGVLIAGLPIGTKLYAAPVDAKAIRSEALEEAAKWFEDEEHPLQPKKVAAAIRRLK